MFDTILVPTDGSVHAAAAVADGFELAGVHDAAVHVLCVADVGPLGGLRLPGDATSAEEAIRQQAQETVDDTLDRAPADLDVTGAVREGPPESEILDYAREIDADLVVMGSRGRGGVHRMAVGSVTDHVVRFGDVPVFVTTASEESS
ncbi:universal stress protein [Halosolutus amylolyticus]|uniref:Universal stress protein n=1 Tax=Halosolutus amylolyticus TaxID=2932267 RepID=A0ABD5PRF3_9EURY|nr:universal stress protein [Halosolutus amylolyticus]